MNCNVLALSHFDKDNSIFEDYCNGIQHNSDSYIYIDYVELYIEKGRKTFENIIKETILSNNIDYLFIIIRSGDLTFSLSFLEDISKITKIIFNFFDTEHYFDSVEKYYAQTANLVILANYFPKFRFELLGINTLCTFALYDKKRYQHYQNPQKSIEVSFVGNVVKSNRSDYIAYLADNCIGVEQFGKGTTNGLISFDRMIEVFGISKINLNFSASADNSILILGENINNRIKQNKGRINEIALCGGFILTEYALGIEDMYEIGQEIDTFRTKGEMLQKINYYLANDTIRNNMASRSYLRATELYDTKNAFKKIMSDGIPNRQNIPIYYDDNFTLKYCYYRFFYIANFILNLSFLKLFPELILLLDLPFLFAKKALKNTKYLYNGASHFFGKFPSLKMKLKDILNIKAYGA